MPARKQRAKQVPAALGFRAHSGWAAMVAVAGTRRAPVVLDRRKIILADPQISGSKQPYHFAEPMEFSKAESYVSRCIERTNALARESVGAVLKELRRNGHTIVGGGLLLGSGRPIPALPAILASHPMIHTAEGELFRDALRQACQRCRVPVAGIKEKQLFDLGTARLKIPVAQLRHRLHKLGQSLGPPWTVDQKLATLAAWLALADAGR